MSIHGILVLFRPINSTENTALKPGTRRGAGGGDNAQHKDEQVLTRPCFVLYSPIDSTENAALKRGTRAAQVVEIMSNTKMSERYLALARDLDVMEPKLPDDVYKMHLVEQRGGAAMASTSMDSAIKNLSATLVNALLNVGFGVDKLVTVKAEGSEKAWIFRNKDQGKICATASIGVRVPCPVNFSMYRSKKGSVCWVDVMYPENLDGSPSFCTTRTWVRSAKQNQLACASPAPLISRCTGHVIFCLLGRRDKDGGGLCQADRKYFSIP